jgi:hypothetical protein
MDIFFEYYAENNRITGSAKMIKGTIRKVSDDQENGVQGLHRS